MRQSPAPASIPTPKSRSSTRAQILKPSPKPPAERRSLALLVVPPRYLNRSRAKTVGPSMRTVFFFLSTSMRTWSREPAASKKFCTTSRTTVGASQRTL
jgi:hypothetical protein